MKRSYARCLTLLAAFLSFASTFVIAQTPPRVTPMTPDVVEKYDQTLPSADYIRREVMVPMRDGVKLFTVVVMKKGVTKAPILLSRTPYNASASTGRVNSQRIVDILEVMERNLSRTTTSACTRTSAACTGPRENGSSIARSRDH